MKTYYMKSENNEIFETSNPDSWKGCVPVSAKVGKELQKQNAIDSLKRIFDTMPEDKRVIYCVLRSVSASGMSRVIDFYTIENDRPQYLSGLIRHALGYRMAKNGGLVVGGCGMDMGFHVVYSVASRLYGGKDGGYQIKQQWI